MTKGKLKHVLTILLVIGACSISFAQTPAWSVNPSGYEFSMTITAILNRDGAISADQNDRVGAFVGSVCRGVTSPSGYTTPEGHKIVFLQVYSNAIAGEKVTFKLHDASAGVTSDAFTTVTFQNDANTGTTASPFVITTNQDPDDILLSSNEIMEGLNIGSPVGQFTPSDPDMTTAADYSYVLVEGGADNANFSVGGDTLKSAIVFDYDLQSSYTILVEVLDGKGGKFRKQIQIQIAVDPEEFAANNYMSPNGDGKNDVWRVKSVEVYKDYKFTIYNDAGVTVFTSTGYNNEWNGTNAGKKLPSGVYYYLVQSPDKTKKFTGTISINRQN